MTIITFNRKLYKTRQSFMDHMESYCSATDVSHKAKADFSTICKENVNLHHYNHTNLKKLFVIVTQVNKKDIFKNFLNQYLHLNYIYFCVLNCNFLYHPHFFHNITSIIIIVFQNKVKFRTQKIKTYIVLWFY